MKTLEEIIEEGYKVKNQCTKSNEFGRYVHGESYIHWLEFSTRYLQQVFPGSPQTVRFEEIANRANGNEEERFFALIGILKALNEIPSINYIDDIDSILKKIFVNFHKCARSILNRYNNRETIDIKDEYDVQDLLEGILRLFVEDVRPEDYVPSYAGGNSRTDFYLPRYDTYIETKMTREKLKDKEVGEQLCIDIARYGSKCKKLICFIYDKENLLKNPYGLINDLQNLSTEKLKVEIYIAPL